jgi:protein ImuB
MRILCIRILEWPFVALCNPRGRAGGVAAHKGEASPEGPVEVGLMAIAGKKGALKKGEIRKVAPTHKLLFVSEKARERGLFPGMTVAQARGLCPEIEIVPPDEGLEQEAMTLFLERLEQAAPVVEDGGPGVAYVEVASVRELYGGIGGIVRTFLSLCEKWGWPCTLGVAGGRFTALTAAVLSGQGEVRVVPEGKGREFLAPLPVDLLPIDPEVRRTLFEVGLDTLGALAAASPAELVARYGDEAALWVALAAAVDEHPLCGHKPRAPLTVTHLFEFAATAVSQLLFALEPALSSLVSTLRAQGRGIYTLLLRLHFEDGDRPVEKRLSLAEPTGRVRPLVDGLRLLLEGGDLSGPVSSFEVLVFRDGPLDGQLGLFPERPGAIGESGAMAELLGRLELLTGRGGMGTYDLKPGRQPEDCWRLLPWGVKGEKLPACRKGVKRGIRLLPGTFHEGQGLALRVLPAPEVIEVEASRDERPYVVDGASVVETAGPFQVAGDWWRGEDDDRFYFETLLDDGLLLWLFRRGHSWFLQGVFD